MAAIPTHYEALADYLRHHVEAEQGALDAYEQALRDRPDDVASYLIRMILGDEARHHDIFEQIKNSLESSIRWQSVDPHLPQMRLEGDDAAQLLETTEKLLALEQEDAKELKALRKEWERDSGERRLWALLVETAEFDTKKHIRMLEFLRSLLRAELA